MRLLVIIQTFSLAFNKLVLFCGNRVYVQKLWLNSFVALFKTINLCLVVRVVYCHSCFSLKASLKKITFWNFILFLLLTNIQIPLETEKFSPHFWSCGYTPDPEHAGFFLSWRFCVFRDGQKLSMWLHQVLLKFGFMYRQKNWNSILVIGYCSAFDLWMFLKWI